VRVVTDSSSARLRSFFALSQSVDIAANDSADVDVCFLPFSPGNYQCALILTDDAVGELLYLINGTALLPLPEEIPVLKNSPGNVNSVLLYAIVFTYYLFYHLFIFLVFCYDFVTVFPF